MTKQQKIMLLLVLAVVSSSAVYYVQTAKDSANSSRDAQTVTGDVGSQNETASNAQVQNQGTGVTDSVKAIETKNTSSKKVTQNVTYDTPENSTETIHVVVTVDASGVVEDIAFSYDRPRKSESREMLQSFERNFSQSMVVGKKIGEVSLSRVGGASLTTRAFNQALSEAATSLNG